MVKLGEDFYKRDNVLTISQELLGKVLCTFFNEEYTSGIIVETEAYKGETDCASHAYQGKRTKRTEIMYSNGGHAYVYLCYGIHHLFNVVTNVQGIPHAILIRAIQPLEGVNIMLRRRNIDNVCPKFTSGPGMLSTAMGISIKHSGKSLLSKDIWIEDGIRNKLNNKIISSPRVGIPYAGKDIFKPWRFRIQDNDWVSNAK